MLHSRKISAAVLIALGAVSMSTHAAAEESIKNVAVPAGSLTVALKMLAEQSGVEFFYSTDQLKGLRTEGVNGEFTAEKAVQKLLEGTNLKLTRHESGALVITVADKAAAADAVPDALEEVVVTALKSGAVALEKAPISVPSPVSFWGSNKGTPGPVCAESGSPGLKCASDLNCSISSQTKR